DGIRDFHVTGVQTCALPIFANAQWVSGGYLVRNASYDKLTPELKATFDEEMAATDKYLGEFTAKADAEGLALLKSRGVTLTTVRSEERRVGKGGRSVGAREE